MKSDLIILFGEAIGRALGGYIEENQVINPQCLWGFIREHIERCEFLDDLTVEQLVRVPPNSWDELAHFGKFNRCYLDVFLDYDSFENMPCKLFELHQVFLVAEEALMLRSKFKKMRVTKLPKIIPASVCKYCWRETENNEICEVHGHGTAARKRADRAMKYYSDILTQLKLELIRNNRKKKTSEKMGNVWEEKEVYVHLNRWAKENGVAFSDKSKLLESLDGTGTSYGLDVLRDKQEKLLRGLQLSSKKPQLLLDAVLLRAEAFLRAEDIVRTNNRYR